MFSLFQLRSHHLPDLSRFPMTPYVFHFKLDKLATGVDNVRYDVLLSSEMCKAAGNVAYCLIAEHTGTEEILGIGHGKAIKDREEFKSLCRDILLDGITKAKLNNEIQIDFLTQAAVAKMMVNQVYDQFETVVQQLKNNLWKEEAAKGQYHSVIFKMKEILLEIQRNKNLIIRGVGANLFQYFTSVQQKDIQQMREVNFGTDFALPEDLFSNPMIHTEDITESMFIIEKYDLLFGNRLEDPDRYDTVLNFFRQLLSHMDKTHIEIKKTITALSEDFEIDYRQVKYDEKLDSLIMGNNNINALLNYFETKSGYKRKKRQKATKEELDYLKHLYKSQKRILTYFYQQFSEKRLLKRIVASYEMQSIYHEYCPPLIPHEVLQFLIVPKLRRNISHKLDRLKKFYDKTYSLGSLRKKINELKTISTEEQKKYLIRFLNNFSNFHRDLHNYNVLKEGMEKINLISDDKIAALSRENLSLYEFLLPHEIETAEVAKAPIGSHVIIKADVRGSTDITFQMKKKNLNPATYFSLNFFNPISNILGEYGAHKIFIEGDAMILSILEQRSEGAEWYTVARACGLAVDMLSIIRQYNRKSEESGLPILELGIGIAFAQGSPTYLFDGNNRIMISPAINLADRLSGCSKLARKQMSEEKNIFNLYVYQTVSDEDITKTADDLLIRYNVNGIELNAAGFKKLSEEINLKQINISLPENLRKNATLYTGKFPTVTGNYKSLTIREAPTPEVSPKDLKIIRYSDRKYYEVCTSSTLQKLKIG